MSRCCVSIAPHRASVVFTTMCAVQMCQPCVGLRVVRVRARALNGSSEPPAAPQTYGRLSARLSRARCTEGQPLSNYIYVCAARRHMCAVFVYSMLRATCATQRKMHNCESIANACIANRMAKHRDGMADRMRPGSRGAAVQKQLLVSSIRARL